MQDGLAAQAQAMGMLSDNITNVNTVGYKETTARFSSLVTSSATATAYAPGGVGNVLTASPSLSPITVPAWAMHSSPWKGSVKRKPALRATTGPVTSSAHCAGASGSFQRM